LNQKVKTPSRIYVDNEYKLMVPRPSTEQRQALKESIKKNGLLNAIIVNPEGKVLDGHTRFDICSELNIIPKLEVRKFDNLNDERMFVITSNLKRRHLTEYCLRILNTNNKKLISDVREERTSVTAAIKSLEKKHSKLSRNNYGNKKIPTNKIMKFCPVCGTPTLESWFDVVEIHCTKCNYYYSIRRRHH